MLVQNRLYNIQVVQREMRISNQVFYSFQPIINEPLLGFHDVLGVGFFQNQVVETNEENPTKKNEFLPLPVP